MNNPFDLLALLLGLAALLSIVNYKLLRLPQTVGLLVGALVLALALIGVDHAAPGVGLRASLRALLARVNLPKTLLQGFLGFLLFAGALGVDFADLLERKWTVLALAIGGTLLSTALVGAGMMGASALFGLGLAPIWCFAFGALIAPTDPVSVLDVLRRVGIPRSMQATIAGESLFNDGIGVVLFTILAGLATGGLGRVDAVGVIRLFAVEAVGGALLGLAAGWLAFLAVKRVDDRNVELMISLALVSATYSLAGSLGTSGPVAVVVAGILIGNHGVRLAMSEETREHLSRFWSLVEEVLNALLFLLIGLQVAAIGFGRDDLLAGAVAIPLCLAARGLSVAGAALPLNLHREKRLAGLAILTWGGLRGALSVAMALSLPDGGPRDLLLSACYAVVVFTLIVQGLSLGRIADWLLHAVPARRATPASPPRAEA